MQTIKPLLAILLLLLALFAGACHDQNDDPSTGSGQADDDAATDDDDNDDDNDDDDTAEPPPGEEDYFVVGPATLIEAAAPLLGHHGGAGKNVVPLDLDALSGASGSIELAEQVRGFLQDLHDPNRRQYVLILGGQHTLPAMYLDPDPNWPGLYAGLSDVYYSDLAGDFDFDGDGNFGEWADDVYDYAPEMFVGRLPFDDPVEVARVAAKIVAFATADADHKWDTLLAAANIAISGDAAIIMEMMRRWVIAPNAYDCWTMYEAGGFIEPDQTLSHEAFVSRVADQPPGLAVWASHGDSYCAYADGPIVCNTDAALFDDARPGVMMSSGCRNADLSKEENLGAALLARGAVAFVGSTTVTDPGLLGEGSVVFLVMIDRTINGNAPLGVALAAARGRYMELFFQPDGFYDVGLFWMNFFGFTLFGDPAMRYWADE